MQSENVQLLLCNKEQSTCLTGSERQSTSTKHLSNWHEQRIEEQEPPGPGSSVDMRRSSLCAILIQ